MPKGDPSGENIGNTSKVCLGPREEVEITPGRGKRAGQEVGGQQAQRLKFKQKVLDTRGAVSRGAAALLSKASCSSAAAHSQTRAAELSLKTKEKSVCTSGGPVLQTPSFGLSLTFVPRKLQGYLKTFISTFNSNENCLVYFQSYLRLLSERTLSS